MCAAAEQIALADLAVVHLPQRLPLVKVWQQGDEISPQTRRQGAIVRSLVRAALKELFISVVIVRWGDLFFSERGRQRFESLVALLSQTGSQ